MGKEMHRQTNHQPNGTISMIKRIAAAVITTVFAVSCLSGCSASSLNQIVPSFTDTPFISDGLLSSGTSRNTATQPATPEEPGYEYTEWDPNIAPDFYRVDGEAIIAYDVAPGEYHFGDLDDLGRATASYAAITPRNYVDEKSQDREDFGSDADRISGWGHNAKIDVVCPDGSERNTWAFARSHLIADSLGGVVDNGAIYNGESVATNLITGTYAQNVGYDNEGGMAYAEEKAREWLETAGDNEYLYYAVTPVYEGDEPVARSVFIDMASSDGEIDEHVEVYNVVGDISGRYTLDYATGWIIDTATDEVLK